MRNVTIELSIPDTIDIEHMIMVTSEAVSFSDNVTIEEYQFYLSLMLQLNKIK